MPANPPPFSERPGFTQLPHQVLDFLLCQNLTRRELSLLFLILRLTLGCRKTEWALLKQADLMAVGIGPGHARVCLEGLLHKGLIEQNSSGAYRFNPGVLEVVCSEQAMRRLQRLDLLISRQLCGRALRRERSGAKLARELFSQGALESSQNGKYPYQNENPAVPETGRAVLPKQEEYPSQNGNVSTGSSWHFDSSSKQFVRKEG